MGKASRRKRESREAEGRHAQRLTALERITGTFVATADARAIVTDSNSIGGIVEGFESSTDALAAAAQAGFADAEVEVLQSSADLLDHFAASGATTLRLGDGSTIHAGCTLGTIVGDCPEMIFAGTFGHPKRLMTRAGHIEDSPRHSRVYPWRRWDLIDAGLAHLRPRAFASAETWWELATGDAATLIAERDVLGPFPSLFGAVLFFSSRERAVRYADALAADATASIHVGPVAGGQVRARPVASIPERLLEILPGSGAATPVILDPGGPRHETAIGTVGSPLFRTVAGLWEFAGPRTFRYVRDWRDFSGTDTFHWRGGDTCNTGPVRRSYDQHLAIRLPQQETAFIDSFLTVLEDRYDAAASTWRLCSTLTGAPNGVVDFERADLQARLRPAAEVPWLVVPADSHGIEQARSKEFERVVAQTAAEVSDRGYRPSDSHTIAAAANDVMKRSRVRAIGWVRDLLIAAKDVPDLLDDLLEMAGSERSELERWLEDNDVLRVAAEAREALIGLLGHEIWAALDPRSRHFLGTAWLHLHMYGDREDVDHSNVTVMCGKTAEVELADLIGSFRGTTQSTAPHNEDDPNDKVLRGFLNGTAKLTLGNCPYLLRPKESDSELRVALKRYLTALPHGEVLVSRPFSKKITSLSKARNPASHDTAIDVAGAQQAWEKLVGVDGILGDIVAWKSTDTSSARGPAPDTPVAFPFRADDYGRVADRYAPRLDDESAVGPLALLDVLSEDDSRSKEHEESFLETVDWMVTSGTLEEMAASALIDDQLVASIRSIHAQWKQHPSTSPPASSPLVLRLAHHLMFEPGKVGHDRVVDDRTGEAYWPLVPGVALGFDRQGVVFLLARSIPTATDPTIDLFQLAFDDRTVASLNEWLNGHRATIWRHRRDFLAVQSTRGVDDCSSLCIVLRRSRPPGGHIPVYLDPTASGRLVEAVTELASGEWGQLATTTRLGRSRPRL